MSDPDSPSPAGKLIIQIERGDGDWPDALVEALSADAIAEAVCKSVDMPGLATVLLSDDAHVKTLNAQFRGKDKPTNVLSFPADEHGEPGYLGDIVLAAETAKREALEEDKLPLHHVTHLIVHGLLHLAGFNHLDNREAEEMETLETDILARLNINDPYKMPAEGVEP